MLNAEACSPIPISSPSELACEDDSWHMEDTSCCLGAMWAHDLGGESNVKGSGIGAERAIVGGKGIGPNVVLRGGGDGRLKSSLGCLEFRAEVEASR